MAQTPRPEEEEEDLGPLPDYVIDPDLPPELRPAPPPRPAPAAPEMALKVTVEVTDLKSGSEASSTELNFPSVASFSISGDRTTVDRGDRPSAPRRTSGADAGTPKKRSSQPAEPGDESSETGWMAGLSNRLSAYSLSEGEEQAEPEGETGENTPPQTDDES